MFCPKCGIQNPATGKFCRSCGTDLGNVSEALTGNLQKGPTCATSGRPLTLEGSLTKLSMGIAFLAVAVILGVSGMGRGWWYWMLIPAFMFIGGGVAQLIQVRSSMRNDVRFATADRTSLSGSMPASSLPSPQTDFVSPESRYKTGDLAPLSVTDNTTSHLELNTEGETMTLPKR